MRFLLPEDGEAVARLAQRDGRNVDETEYARFLRLEGASGIAASRDGELVGAITAIRYFEHGFLGPAMVPEENDAGLALLLVGRAVEALRRSGASYIETEASAQDAPLFEGLGFQTIHETVVLQRDPSSATQSLSTIALSDEHALDVGILDAGVAGYGRKEYILALRDACPHGARVLERHGEVEGFIVARRAKRGHHLGPLVTRGADLADAKALLIDAIAALSDSPLVVLAERTSPVIPLLEAQGFTEVGSLRRMRAGERASADAALGTQWLTGGRLTG